MTAFVLLIYIDDGNLETPHLFCCFASDFEKEPWTQEDDEFVLRFSRSNLEVTLGAFKVDANVAERIKDVIRNANMEEVMAAIAKAQKDRKMESVIDAVNVAMRTGANLPAVLGAIQEGIKKKTEQSEK